MDLSNAGAVLAGLAGSVRGRTGEAAGSAERVGVRVVAARRCTPVPAGLAAIVRAPARRSAPAAGTAVEVVDGVADNPPGRMDPQQATGNRVVIDHGNSEYSMLVHLRAGSLRIGKGARVRAGDRIGGCGDSGHSSEPHLHYQLQDGPASGVSAGLPAQLSNYLADGQPVARGEPIRGQRVRSATQSVDREIRGKTAKTGSADRTIP